MLKTDLYNNNALKLWSEWKQKLETYTDQPLLLPLLYPELQNGGIVFIGINPSFIAKVYEKQMAQLGFTERSAEEFLSWVNYEIKTGDEKQNYLNLVQTLERSTRASYNVFFKKYQKLADSLGVEWAHIDLFFNRVTNQKQFLNRFISNNELKELNESQFELSWGLFQDISPRVIVVFNALASKIIQEKQNIGKNNWNDEKGYDEIVINGNKVPIFFSGMLTGQRALDDGSYKRLEWHIRRSLKI